MILNSLYFSACPWQTPVSIFCFDFFCQTSLTNHVNMKVDKQSLEHANLLQLEWGYYWIFWLAMSLECSPTSWPSLPMASRSATETQDADFVILLCPGFGQMTIYLSTPTRRSLWSQWGSQVSLSRLFVIVMKLMVWHFVSGSHKVMAALVV
jgi:hypothetical protein